MVIKKSKTLEETYQKKTPKEHILLRPDSYIGSVEMDTQTTYVWDDDKKKILNKKINYVPGLYKIFDEILVNAADNKQRDKRMSKLKVVITNRTISIYNNGKGIPIKIHSKENVYIPELIFGHLLTSSNYDDKERKTTGGRNGYGAKLCNIFSKKFTVETCDGKHLYKQEFMDNMSITGENIIERCFEEQFTRITFEPDFKRFKMKELDDDIQSLLKKRVYDMCATIKNCSVYLNNELLNIHSFKDYVQLYFEKDVKIVYKTINDRWELACTSAEDQFTQVSFVNSISTMKGGTHVNHVLDQMTQPIIDFVKRKDKNLSIKPVNIKNSIFVFINCLINNPAFDSQTKENLTLKISSFGSKCLPIDDFVKQVIKQTDIIEKVVSFGKAKQNTLLKKSDGSKTSKLTGIPKLEDANMAGTKNSSLCTLILTEGDSAKTLAVAGLAVVGRDHYGVFPLRGKLLNVREASYKQITENNEVTFIKKIMGFKHGETYQSADSLRYGHIMIMTDQDHDGSHIKGLIINLIDHFYPSLLKVSGFIKEFITPIVRASKKGSSVNKITKDFFTMPEYERFKEELERNNDKRWTIKYYKGLGTSTTLDAKQYFTNLDLHVKYFLPVNDEDVGLIDLAFNKKKADERKFWLSEHTLGTYLDHSMKNITIKDFVNKELVLFSIADNARSIPSVIDGFKPGQRKVIFSCFKRKLTGEIKVAQLVGYVSEHSSYHHGEASLSSTIINLAHDYVGSNNINLMLPIGQFGSRLLGGKDSASPRYIYTSLNPITRLIFNELDDPVLNYYTEDNLQIEPEWYVPVIPMVLINGSEGIGTGWSTNIPSYNPLEIMKNIRRKLLGTQEMFEMNPFYKNWTGEIIPFVPGKFICCGVANELNDGKEFNILELPIGTWTNNYKEYLDSCMVKNEIFKYKDYSTDKSIDIIIGVNTGFKMKLATSISTTNMVCFDSTGKIKKYDSPLDIINEYYPVRLNYYQKRKDYTLKFLDLDLSKIKNKIRFIQKVTSNELIVMKRKASEIIEEMITLNFIKFEKSFDYLLDMPISNLTKEKIEKLEKEYLKKKSDFDALKGKKIKDLWLEDLDILEDAYRKILKKEQTTIQKEISDKNKRQFKKAKNVTGKLDVYSQYKASKSSSNISLNNKGSNSSKLSLSTASLSSKPDVRVVKPSPKSLKSGSMNIKESLKSIKTGKKNIKSPNQKKKEEFIDLNNKERNDSNEEIVISDDSDDSGPWNKYKN